MCKSATGFCKRRVRGFFAAVNSGINDCHARRLITFAGLSIRITCLPELHASISLLGLPLHWDSSPLNVTVYEKKRNSQESVAVMDVAL